MAMTAEEAIMWKGKMCLNGCDDCDILKEAHKSGIKGGLECERFFAKNSRKALEIIEKYKNFHRKTIAQDFFEKFPNAPKRESGVPMVCPWFCGYVDADNCPNDEDVETRCFTCWSRPMEGV